MHVNLDSQTIWVSLEVLSGLCSNRCRCPKKKVCASGFCLLFSMTKKRQIPLYFHTGVFSKNTYRWAVIQTWISLRWTSSSGLSSSNSYLKTTTIQPTWSIQNVLNLLESHTLSKPHRRCPSQKKIFLCPCLSEMHDIPRHHNPVTLSGYICTQTSRFQQRDPCFHQHEHCHHIWWLLQPLTYISEQKTLMYIPWQS